MRRAIDDDGDEAEARPRAPAGATTVVCIPELVAACQAMAAADSTLAVEIEEAGTTYERLVDDPCRRRRHGSRSLRGPMVANAVAMTGGRTRSPTRRAWPSATW